MKTKKIIPGKHRPEMDNMLSEAAIALIAIDNEGIITYCNGKTLNLIPVKSETVIGTNANDTLGYFFGNDLSEALNGRDFTTTVKTPLSRIFEKKYSAIRDSNGNESGTVCIATDITMRYKIAKDLENNYYRAGVLFKYMPAAMIDIDATELSIYIEDKKKNGITDFGELFKNYPEEIYNCCSLLNITDINDGAIELIEADNKDEAIFGFPRLFIDETYVTLQSSIESFYKKTMKFECKTQILTLKNNLRSINLKISIILDYEQPRILINFDVV